jgi:hypothetical protein
MKLDVALKGQPPYLKDHLKQYVSQENALTICDYILAYQVEASSLSDHHKTNVILTLKKLSTLHQNQPFRDMTKQEIIAYLDTHRKSEQKDPEHKWKAATYNHYLTALIRFYRRLKYPNLEHAIRLKKTKLEQVGDIVPTKSGSKNPAMFCCILAPIDPKVCKLCHELVIVWIELDTVSYCCCCCCLGWQDNAKISEARE